MSDSVVAFQYELVPRAVHGADRHAGHPGKPGYCTELDAKRYAEEQITRILTLQRGDEPDIGTFQHGGLLLSFNRAPAYLLVSFFM